MDALRNVEVFGVPAEGVNGSSQKPGALDEQIE